MYMVILPAKRCDIVIAKNIQKANVTYLMANK